MVLPAAIFALKAFGWAQGIVLFNLGFREIRELKRGDAGSSHTVSPAILLAYRTAMLLLCLAVGIPQLATRGFVVFVFFTVWNWWLLTLYFAAAVVSSWRSWQASRRSDQQTSVAVVGDVSAVDVNRAGDEAAPLHQAANYGNAVIPSPPHHHHPADWIEKAAATLFHVIVPVAVSIDLITWLILVPMLLAVPDPVQVARWRAIMFSPSSYMQHGGNAVMILGDLALNKIPVLFFWGKAFVTLWASLFGVWSVVFFSKTGRFIYPFLDAHKPGAWVTYTGLLVGNWLLFFAFIGVMKMKHAVMWRSVGGRSAAVSARKKVQ